MRVLHVMASGARGGGAEHLRGLVRAQRTSGDVAPTIALSEDGPLATEMMRAGFDVHVIELMRSRFDVTAPRRLVSLLARTRPDLVHYHGTRAAFFGALAARLGGSTVPSVYTVHGLAYRQQATRLRLALLRAAEALACRAATRVISVSRRDLDDLVERRFVPRDHGSHVPNAVDLEAFGNGCARSVRQALGIAPGRFVVGTVARLVPQKAVADLILAMVHVRDAVLVSVGDGPERARLQALAATHGVHVLFLGARADVPRLLPALDVFALSSRWEGEPLALLEALAAGLPCVATATEGAREVLEGHAAGWLTPVGDPRALGIALDALRRDAERRARMAAAARELVTQRTWENAARQVLEVYRAALAH